MQTFIKILVPVFILAFLSSCNSTKVVSSWSLPDPPAGTMKKVLVLGVMTNRGQRDKLENYMTQELSKSGISATTATSVFGPNRFRGLSEEEITKRLKGSDYSSVMIISLIDKEKELNYYPGSFYASPYPYYGYRFYRRYMFIYDRMYTPGYYQESTKYVLDAEIYSIDSDELIYSAQTRSYDPGSDNALAGSFTSSIITELKQKRLIP